MLTDAKCAAIHQIFTQCQSDIRGTDLQIKALQAQNTASSKVYVKCAMSILWPDFNIEDADERFTSFLKTNRIRRNHNAATYVVSWTIERLSGVVMQLSTARLSDEVLDHLVGTLTSGTFVSFGAWGGVLDINLDEYAHLNDEEASKQLNRQLEPYRAGKCIPHSTRCTVWTVVGTRRRHVDVSFDSD